MQSMRTTLTKPYDEDKAATEANNSVKLSLQDTMEERTKIHSQARLYANSWLSTTLAKVNSQCKQEFEN